jgi:membrane fusion protein, heavy metal efflux system
VNTVGAGPNGLSGHIDSVSYLIDPFQHSGVVRGYVDNPGEQIRGGQYASATVRLPPPPGVVEIPMEALVDDGEQAVVFVQTDPAKHQYTMRRVQVTHRFEGRVFVRSTPIPQVEQATADELKKGRLLKEPLHEGELVLQTGAGELKARLMILESLPENQGK